jgi:hypothetical protein
LPNGGIGIAYSANLTASGGTLPYTWSITGVLPQGVTLDTESGTLSGFPLQFGSFTSLKVTVMDANLLSFTKTMQLTVVSPVSISTPTLAAGVSGVTYSSTLSASGGLSPYTWAIAAGVLPSGLYFYTSTATVSGIPTVTGSFNLTFSVKDTLAQTALKSFLLTVVPPLDISTLSLPNGAVGIAYSTSLTAANGVAPFTWSVSSDAPPALPPGLSLDQATGVVSGTPTLSGSYTMTFHVRDSQDADKDKDFTIVIVPILTITTSSLPAGLVGVMYSVTLAAYGGAKPLTWSVTGALPSGLSFNTSTAVLSGIPLASGSFSLFFSTLDILFQTAEKSLSITILASPTKPSVPTSPRKPSSPATFPTKPLASPVQSPVKPAAVPVTKPAPVSKPTPVKKPALAPVSKPTPVKKPALAPVLKPTPVKKPAPAPVTKPVKPSPTNTCTLFYVASI